MQYLSHCFSGKGELDNSEAVAAAKAIENHYQILVELAMQL